MASLPIPLIPLFDCIVGVCVPDSAANLICFSWVSLTEFSRSLKRDRNQSTVKLSTVSVLGWSLPNVSSINASSNSKTIGFAGDVLVTDKYIVIMVLQLSYLMITCFETHWHRTSMLCWNFSFLCWVNNRQTAKLNHF